MATALLIARLCIGLGLAAHGAQKVFGWYGGYGLKGTGGFFEGLGYKPGVLFALAAGLGEFLGGLLTALGLGGPIGPAMIILVMLVALFTVHWGHGFFVTSNGVELPLMNIAGALVLAIAGPGPYSVDALAGLGGIWTEQSSWIVVGVAVVGALVNIVIRRPAKTQAAS
jgi:putative oxidoreductase